VTGGEHGEGTEVELCAVAVPVVVEARKQHFVPTEHQPPAASCSLLADEVHPGASDGCNHHCNVHEPHAPETQERPQPGIIRMPAASVVVFE